MIDNTDNADSTALISEARAWATKAAFVGRNVIRDLDKGILYTRQLADALEAALAAAGVTQPEPGSRATIQQKVHLFKAGAWEFVPNPYQEHEGD